MQESTIDFDRIAFDGNKATDGGALFVDLLGDLSISRSALRDNIAYRNGGGLSVGSIATVKLNGTEGVNNHAGASGGMAYFVGIMSAELNEVSAIGNTAGKGGAFAMFDSLRTVSQIVNSSVNANSASDKGGGLYIKDTAITVKETQLRSNAVDHGDGGAAAISGEEADLNFLDTECVTVEILLDWGTAGLGCPVFDGTTCDTYGQSCSFWRNISAMTNNAVAVTVAREFT